MSLEALVKVQKILARRKAAKLISDPKVYGYIRTSKTEREQKYSSDYQERAITDFYEMSVKNVNSPMHGVAFGGFFLDRVSGSKEIIDRTAGRVMLNRLMPGDFLICYNMDRLSRGIYDSANVLQLFSMFGIVLMTTDGETDLSSTIGQTMAMVKVGFAQHERERLIDRTKRAHAQRRLVKRKCLVSCRSSPGWKRRRIKGEWMQTKCSSSRITAMKIVVWRDQEALTWDEIGRRLRRRNIKHGTTKTWEHRTVREWYEAAKAGFPCTSNNKRENLPPLTIEVPEPATAAFDPTM
jgi:DNA invertase Pin-like site-specific DNA recombinase